jgi:C-terminal processing protease CtpA/Prc
METKFNSLIKKYGIPKYLKKWIPASKSFDIKSSLKTYHKHSFIINPQEKSTYKAFIKMPKVKFGLDKIGIITIYSFITYDDNTKKNTIKKMTEIIHNFLDKVEKEMIGLIIDFRYHQGGNFWPVIKFFDRYLNNSTLFAFTNVKIKKEEKGWMNLENKKIKYNTYFKRENVSIRIPIAIIIGHNTGSSGEFAAALFKGRNNIRFFGNKTAGYLSSNQNYKINKDIDIVLTNQLITTYDGIFRDEEFLEADVKTSKPITDAKKWIKIEKFTN